MNYFRKNEHFFKFRTILKKLWTLWRKRYWAKFKRLSFFENWQQFSRRFFKLLKNGYFTDSFSNMNIFLNLWTIVYGGNIFWNSEHFSKSIGIFHIYEQNSLKRKKNWFRNLLEVYQKRKKLLVTSGSGPIQGTLKRLNGLAQLEWSLGLPCEKQPQFDLKCVE